MRNNIERDYESMIVERAANLGLLVDKPINHMIDLSIATEVFNISEEEFLRADDGTFIHDFVGIYNNIDREMYNRTHKKNTEMFNCFVPRLANTL